MSKSQNEKRPYVKRDLAHWEGRKSKQSSTAAQSPVTVYAAPTSAAANTEAQPFPEVSYGSCGPQSSSNVRNGQINQPLVDPGAFQNIIALPLPYVGYNGTRTGFGGSYIGASNAIDLCGRAWAGVPVVRNAIELSVEFSNQPLYIKCKNKTVKKFFEEWLRAIKINSLKEQFFREYYRSGNVFMLLFEGKFGPRYYQNFQTTFGAKENRIPIRYELLNPTNVFVPVGLVANYTYVRLLSTYEITRLQNPLTPQDKQVYDDLPQDAKDQIKSYNAANPMGIYIPLDGKRLRFAFYKKQSYEPLAVPMVWPVLPDVEWKLVLKKQDKALVQNVERILLLVTTGEAPNDWNKGKGINQNNINNLQNLLTNQTLNRVLVTDYSVKANFIQPDLSGLGPEKYTQVNEDIREGLQSILTGDDKFANAQIKAKIFIQRLEEGQNVFLDDFLNIEIERICDQMGFRDKPLVRFRKIALQDEAVMARVVAQLGQLGILTGKQVVNGLENGVLPDADEMDEAQDEYVKERENGKYFPLVGGSQKQDGEGGAGGRPAGTTGIKQSTKKIAPIGTGKAAVDTPQFSMSAVVNTLRASSNLEESVAAELRRKFKLKELDAPQQSIAREIAKNVMANYSKAEWESAAKKAASKPPKIAEAVAQELDDIRRTYRLKDDFEALIIKHSQITA